MIDRDELQKALEDTSPAPFESNPWHIVHKAAEAHLKTLPVRKYRLKCTRKGCSNVPDYHAPSETFSTYDGAEHRARVAMEDGFDGVTITRIS